MAAVLLRYVQQPYVAPSDTCAAQAQESLERERRPLSEVFAISRTA
jgi:hypothetical protein